MRKLRSSVSPFDPDLLAEAYRQKWVDDLGKTYTGWTLAERLVNRGAYESLEGFLSTIFMRSLKAIIKTQLRTYRRIG